MTLAPASLVPDLEAIGLLARLVRVRPAGERDRHWRSHAWIRQGEAVIRRNQSADTASILGRHNLTGLVAFERLPVGHGDNVYVEPRDGVVVAVQVGPAIVSLCRNATTHAGMTSLM